MVLLYLSLKHLQFSSLFFYPAPNIFTQPKFEPGTPQSKFTNLFLMAEIETDDEREIELDSIKAIFGELRLEDPYTAFLDIPVTPEAPLPIVFRTVDGVPPTPPSSDNGATADKDAQPSAIPIPLDVHNLSYLPPLRLQITLPKGYPSDEPPQFILTTCPNWIPKETLQNLELNGLHLWYEYGHGQVVFAFIDQLQQSAERAFGLAVDGPLLLSQDMRIALLDFDRKAARQKFDAETFDCGVCLEPKKGSVCHRIVPCGHVFCVCCLQSFFNNCITEGDISSVKCLSPECGASARGRKQKTLSPSQLLQIPLDKDIVKRYVNLKRKKKLESDQSTVYCPRKWCQGPARSSKHPKLTDPATFDSSDSSEDQGTPQANNANQTDRLAICSSCTYAFCRSCLSSWHGDHVACPRTSGTPQPELSADERASLDYIRQHTSACPTCNVPCQKTHGCNHMRCFHCLTHFCYLCAAWLDAANPYRHFNEPGKGCYMKLWELEEGDEAGAAAAAGVFGGPRMAEHEAVAWERIQAEELAAAAQEAERMGAARLDEMLGPRVDDEAPEVVVMVERVNLLGRPPARGGPRRRGTARGRAVNMDERWNAGIQRFLAMAQADEEDEWDSDELDDGDDWRIPVRE